MTAGTDVIALSDDEAHHLVRVRRLGRGDVVRLFDGAGGEWEGRVDSIARDRAVVAIDGPVTPIAEPPVRVTLAIGILKGDQMDEVVRDATALGVAAVVPLATHHVAVAARAWRSGMARDRSRRIAIAAAKQCGRAVVPDIHPVMALDALLAQHSEVPLIAALEPGAAGLPPANFDNLPATLIALVGPEGGWSSAELGVMRERGTTAMTLGPRTLRAELAPTVLLSTLWTLWGWVGTAKNRHDQNPLGSVIW